MIYLINTIIYIIAQLKFFDVKWNTYIDSSQKIDNKDRKSKIGDIARISKYKNILESLKKFLRLKKSKVLHCEQMLLVFLLEK